MSLRQEIDREDVAQLRPDARPELPFAHELAPQLGLQFVGARQPPGAETLRRHAAGIEACASQHIAHEEVPVVCLQYLGGQAQQRLTSFQPRPVEWECKITIERAVWIVGRFGAGRRVPRRGVDISPVFDAVVSRDGALSTHEVRGLSLQRRRERSTGQVRQAGEIKVLGRLPPLDRVPCNLQLILKATGLRSFDQKAGGCFDPGPLGSVNSDPADEPLAPSRDAAVPGDLLKIEDIGRNEHSDAASRICRVQETSRSPLWVRLHKNVLVVFTVKQFLGPRPRKGPRQLGGCWERGPTGRLLRHGMPRMPAQGCDLVAKLG